MRVRSLLLGAQLVALLAASTFQWSRHDLTLDFAFYAQMWWSFAHGHWNPYSTVFGFSAIRNNFELIMWPLGLLAPISPSPLTLLYLQDLALVGTGWEALRWADDVLASRPAPRTYRRVVITAATVAVMSNPWLYQTAFFDFHTHALAGLLAVLGGREIFGMDRQRKWIWVLLLACTGTVGLLVTAGLGGAMMLTPPRRRRLEGLGIAAGHRIAGPPPGWADRAVLWAGGAE